MSTIDSLVHAFGNNAWRQSESAAANVGAFVQLYWEAIRDGLAASRRYHELTTHGVQHDVAVREIFVEHFN